MVGALVAAALTLTLAGCNASAEKPAEAAPTASSAQFPVTQTNVWGETRIEQQPTRIAVVSGGDRDIAYALGLTPIIMPVCPDCFVSPYVTAAEQKLGIADPVTYDSSDGTNIEAIAAAEPDVILGVNSYSMEDDYAKLAQIAPVVTFTDPDQVSSWTWSERLLRAAEALGMTEQAQQVIVANQKVAVDAAAAHPELAGKTYTYVVVHPQQLTYVSSSDQDPGVFEDLGLTKAPNASKFSTKADAVSMENLDQIEADIVLVAYPFGDDGVVSRDKLESSKLWRSVPAIKEGRCGVVDAESGLASDIAYPTVLSYPWVVEQITPVLVAAANGQGGS